MITDADRLAAAGAELVIDGHTFHVRYTPRSLKLMEDRYGDLDLAMQALTELESGKGPLIGTVFFILALGLRHERTDSGMVDEDWLLDHGDTLALGEYASAAFGALIESLPKPAELSVDPTQPPTGPNPNGSNGITTSGSRLDTSTAVPPSSGTL